MSKILEGHKQRAVSYLRKKGMPATGTEICKACDIPQGSHTAVFKDKRFIKTDRQLVWLAAYQLYSSVAWIRSPNAAKTESFVLDKQPPQNKWFEVIHNLLRHKQPLKLDEVARMTKIPQVDCFRILSGPAFERDCGRLYWLAKRSYSNNGYSES